MPLTIEDGSVVAGADAYEDEATTTARLSGLGLSSLTGQTSAEKEAAIRRATAEVEDAIRDFVEGSPHNELQATQPRLFPRRNCFDTTMREFLSSEIPETLKRAIALRAEDHAAGRVTEGRTDIQSEASARGSITYSRNGSANVFAKESGAAWQAVKPLVWVT